MQNKYKATISGYQARFALPHVGWHQLRNGLATAVGINAVDASNYMPRENKPWGDTADHMYDGGKYGVNIDTDPPRDWVLMDRR